MTPTRDIGVFLKTGGKDTGVNSGVKILSAREMAQAPPESSKLGQQSTKVAPSDQSYIPQMKQNPSVRGTPQQAMAKQRALQGQQSSPSVPTPASRVPHRQLSDRSQPIAPHAKPRPNPSPKPTTRPRAAVSSSQSNSPIIGDESEMDDFPEPFQILEDLDLTKYRNIIETENITKFMFIRCDDDMLAEIGIANPSHRDTILSHIRKLQIDCKVQQAKRLRENAAQRRQLAPQLQDENPEIRRSARESVGKLEANAPDWMAERQKKLLARQREIAKVQEQREAADKAEAVRRDSSVSLHMTDAARIAKERELQRQANLESERIQREKDEAQKAQQKTIEEENRLEHIRKDAEKKKALEEKAAKLEVSERTEKLVQTRERTRSQSNIFAVPPEEDEWGKGKSKIWKALNPRPLAYQSPREQAERREETETATASTANSTDYTYLAGVRSEGIAPDVDSMEDTLDGFDDDGSDDGNQFETGTSTAPQDESSEEEDVDPDSLGGLDDDFMKQMAANRAKREQEELERKESLRKQYEEQKRKEQEERDKELAIIAAQQKLEREKAEAQKEKDVAEARARMATELTFDFSFG